MLKKILCQILLVSVFLYLASGYWVSRMQLLRKILFGIPMFICAVFLLSGLVASFAQTSEEITITTYYPSPYGVYQNLVAGEITSPFLNNANGIEIQGPQAVFSLHRVGTSRWALHNDTLGNFNIMLANDSFPGALDGFGRYPSSLVISQTGNVGIGTTTPLSKMHLILGDTNGPLVLQGDASNIGVDIQWYDSDDDAAGPPWSGKYKWDFSYRSGNLSSPSPPDSLMLFKSDALPMMTWTQGGNVGIGTTNPTATLQLNGTASIFGMWQTRDAGTEYTAPTDGFVVAYDTNQVCIEGYTPSATVRVRAHTIADNHSITFPVRKGDTWTVIASDCGGGGAIPDTRVYWLPIGN